ncbi:MAG: shikimate dehydrogenase [Novosphingobium sp.]|nr:MAG: shikimate dehydrogenase [Novosphingobium sp.]
MPDPRHRNGSGTFLVETQMLRSGLIGRAIAKSRSPLLHEQEARAQGLDLSYRLFDFDELGLADGDLANLLVRLRDEGFCGVNVTYPFKQAIIPLLDELAESAALVGAVNTIAIRDGRLTGHNTDMEGFRDSVREGLPGAPMGRVLQLGTGGAGAAVGCALLSLGVERLILADVDPARAQALAEALEARFGAGRVAVQDSAALSTDAVDGIVNATPMGMAANPQSAIAPELILPRHWVADIVYFPLETEMLRLARAKGCRVLNGSGMVIAQAAKAFEIMTGHPADVARMRASFAAA